MMTAHCVSNLPGKLIRPAVIDQPSGQCDLAYEGMVDLRIRNSARVKSGEVLPFTLKARASFAEVMGCDQE